MPPPKNWQMNFLLQDNKNNSFCKQKVPKKEDRHLAYEIHYGVVRERQQTNIFGTDIPQGYIFFPAFQSVLCRI